MARELPLNAYASTVLDSNGNGTASVGPTAQGEIWQAYLTAAVNADSNANEAICKLYVGGGPSAAYFVGSTSWGSTGDSNSQSPQVQVGQQVYAVWAGGDPGATAHLSINGTKVI